jgi:hypothetical protein
MQVNSVEEHVRAAAEYKLGVANQSITAGFFDDDTRSLPTSGLSSLLALTKLDLLELLILIHSLSDEQIRNQEPLCFHCNVMGGCTYEVLIETDYRVEVFALLSASVIECQIEWQLRLSSF